jgi:hypothetical protein
MTVQKNELIVIQKESVESVFTIAGCDPILSKITEQAKSFVPDMTTLKGRSDIASMAYRVSKSKTYLDDLGKELVSEWKEKSKAVDASRRKIRDYLDNLRDEVRAPLDQWEQREKERISKHEQGILKIQSYLSFSANTSLELEEELHGLNSVIIDDSWDEYKAKANVLKLQSVKYLELKIESKKHEEKERAELERLRKEDETRKQKEREAQIAKEAEERAKREFELKLQAEKKRAQEEKESTARAEAEKTAKLEKDKKEAEERAKRAEKEKQEALKKAEEDSKRAVEAERKKIKDQQERDAVELEKKEANKAHCAKINNQSVDDLMDACPWILKDQAKQVIALIAKKEIRNIEIKY